nr:RNA-directed DNA polymerase, eukaryota, nucleotide-binding alpha-beta plait domain protein [Tanacetum cinerariifolium]
MGTSRNAECSNCKHLLDKITVLEATVDMYMHPEQHTVNSAALFHEVYSNMRNLTWSSLSFGINMDHACAIARSTFVTNFPDSTSSKDLWKLCQSYGTVIDVYILNRRSKAGK